MSLIVTDITARAAEETCNVDVLVLHDVLLNLPTEKYLALYKIMSTELAKVYPPMQNNF